MVVIVMTWRTQDRNIRLTRSSASAPEEENMNTGVRVTAFPAKATRTARSVVVARASSSISISTKSCPLNFGESLAVVSNANAWEPSTATQLSWSEGDIWQGQVEVDGIETLEFKLVKVGGDGAVIEWEDGENKQVDVKGTKTLECSWGSSELQVAEKKATRKRTPKKKAAAVVAEEPTPVVEEPTPVVEEPAPVVEEPAPVVEPTPTPERVVAAPTVGAGEIMYTFDEGDHEESAADIAKRMYGQ